MIWKILKILIPTIVLGVAIFVGWLNTFPIPEGTLFTMIYPALKGYVPPVWSGGFQTTPVPPLPDKDYSIEPRPAKETFLILPGFVEPEPAKVEEEPPASEEEVSEEGTDAETEERELQEEEAAPVVDDAVKYAGYRIPQQGIGMCCRYTAYDPESVRRTILWYLKMGGRHIDTADLYQNHEWIGEAIQIAMRDYGIPRDELFVTTKLWPKMFGENSTKRAIPRMLQELQLDYIDMVLFHGPASTFQLLGPKEECAQKNLSPKECRQETWKALSTFRDSGLVRHVGVSNFNIRQLQDLMSMENVAPIANNQFQYNPWMPDEKHEVFAFCQEHGITVTAWSSFGGTTLQHLEAFSVETLQTIAENHDTSVAQVLLKWALQLGAIVIPGTGNPKHMRENLNAFNLELTEQEMKEITALRTDESAKKFFAMPTDDS